MQTLRETADHRFVAEMKVNVLETLQQYIISDGALIKKIKT